MTHRLPFITIVSRICLLCLALTAGPALAKEYFVDQKHPSASDNNAGTAAQPWKTIARAGKAKELQPGDTVLIKSGLYREAANITVSGEPGKPVTFAAAPRRPRGRQRLGTDPRPVDPHQPGARK